MLVKFSELNDHALVLANILRNFDPETMFWRSNSPVIFPNYDQDGFTPVKEIRKPFGVQKILESFAKSQGFNSYNGMSSEIESQGNTNRLMLVDLKPLNPNPRNEYFTEYWNVFTTTILVDAFRDSEHYPKLPYLIYRNFKQAELSKYAPYMGWGMSSICRFDYYCKKEVRIGDIQGHFGNRLELPVSNYYPIAESILFTILAMDLDTHVEYWNMLPPSSDDPGYMEIYKQNIPKNYSYSIKNVPFKSFLVHEEWNHDKFTPFAKALSLAMKEFFGVNLTIHGRSRNPLEKLVSINIPFDIKEKLNKAKAIHDLHIRMKSLVLQCADQVKDDTKYYLHSKFNYSTVLQDADANEEITASIYRRLLETNEINAVNPIGTKQTWINRPFAFSRLNRFVDWNDHQLSSYIQEEVLDLLEPYTPTQTQDDRRAFKYDFKLLNIDNFSSELIKDIVLPKTITVYSKFELNHYFAEMAVQAQIMKLLPSSLNMDSLVKYTGMPSCLKFNLDLYGKSHEESIKIRRISNLKEEADLVIDFNIKDIIQSITLELFDEEEYESYGFNESNIEIMPGDASDEDKPLTLDNFFPSQYGFKCFKFNLCLIDTVYKDSFIFDNNGEGWNTLSVYAQFNQEYNILSLDHLEYLEERRSKPILRKINEALSNLSETDDFKIFLLESFDHIAKRFNAAEEKRFNAEKAKRLLNPDDHSMIMTESDLFDLLTYYGE